MTATRSNALGFEAPFPEWVTSGPDGARPPGPIVRSNVYLQHQLPEVRGDVRLGAGRRLVPLQCAVDVAHEPRPITHLVDDLHRPVAVLVVDTLPEIGPLGGRLGRRRNRHARLVVDAVEVDE